MSNNGLAKLTGAPFTRIQPGLCGYCKFYEFHPEAGEWAEQCGAKGKILSNPHAVHGRCKLFERAEVQPVKDETIKEWVQSAQEYQGWKERRKQRGYGSLLDLLFSE